MSAIFLNISLLELKVKIILLYKGKKFCNHSNSNLDFLLHKNTILQVYFQNAFYTQLPQCAMWICAMCAICVQCVCNVCAICVQCAMWILGPLYSIACQQLRYHISNAHIELNVANRSFLHASSSCLYERYYWKRRPACLHNFSQSATGVEGRFTEPNFF